MIPRGLGFWFINFAFHSTTDPPVSALFFFFYCVPYCRSNSTVLHNERSSSIEMHGRRKRACHNSK